MLSILTELGYNIVKFLHKLKKTEHAGYMLGPAIDGSHRGDRLNERIIHPSRKLKGGLFLFEGQNTYD
jgi:hypothetical protein